MNLAEKFQSFEFPKKTVWIHGFDIVLCARLIISVVLLCVCLIAELKASTELILLIISALLSFLDVIFDAARKFLSKMYLSDSLLITVALLSAFLLGYRVSAAAAAIMWRACVMFSDYAADLTLETAKRVIVNVPETCRLVRDGVTREVSTDLIQPGDTFVVETGAYFPVDCVISTGDIVIDCFALWGAQGDVKIEPEQFIPAGAVNRSATVIAEAVRTAEMSAAEKILSSAMAEPGRKSSEELVAEQFTAIYTPVLAIFACMVSTLPYLFTTLSPQLCYYLAITLIVTACSGQFFTPLRLTYLAAKAGAASSGVLIKDNLSLSRFSSIRACVFNKEKALCEPEYRVSAVKSARMDANMMLKIAAHVEAYSGHPISQSIVAAYGGPIYIELIEDFSEVPGEGVSVTIGDIPVIMGNESYLNSLNIDINEKESAAEAVYMAIGGQYAGRITIREAVRNDAQASVAAIRESGCDKISMIYSSNPKTAEPLAARLGISARRVEAAQLQNEAVLKELLTCDAATGYTAYITGDGDISNAADLNIAVSSPGRFSICEDEDAVIINGMPSSISTAITKSRAVKRQLMLNFAIFSVTKLVLITMALLISAPVWFSVFIQGASGIGMILISYKAFKS